MAKQKYYSLRTGKNPYASKIDLSMLLKLFSKMYQVFENDGYFQEAFGKYCVSAHDNEPGKLGSNIGEKMSLMFRKLNLWPISKNCSNYSEEDLFDVIEFLYQWVSKPIDGRDCNLFDSPHCWHYRRFDQKSGRREFRTKTNELLHDYERGYELSKSGEVLVSIEQGLNDLIEEPFKEYDINNIDNKIKEAKSKFRRARSTPDERRDAIRDMVDVLEFLRPQIKDILPSKDESDLFNIANNFGIRHHNCQQKTNYDKDIWYEWMFYYYLATINATRKLIAKNEE